MTGFDKVFKPALRFDAIERSLSNALKGSLSGADAAKIVAENDKQLGVLAKVHMNCQKTPEKETAVNSALKVFSTQFSVQWAQ